MILEQVLATSEPIFAAPSSHKVVLPKNWLETLQVVIDSGFVGSTGGVPQEQKMLKGHLPRVLYHQVY